MRRLQSPALMFSGGRDSSSLAWAMLHEGVGFRAYTGGMENSADLKFLSGLRLPFKYQPIIFKKEVVAETYRRLLKDYEQWEADLLVPLELMLPAIDEEEIVFGTGSEELFAGYNRHAVYLSEFGLDTANDLLWSDWAWLFLNEGRLYTDYLAERGKKAVFPYLEPAVTRLVARIPAQMRLYPFAQKKPIMFLLAEYLGVPEPIARRPKKALQYSTGVAKIRRKLR